MIRMKEITCAGIRGVKSLCPLKFTCFLLNRGGIKYNCASALRVICRV